MTCLNDEHKEYTEILTKIMKLNSVLQDLLRQSLVLTGEANSTKTELENCKVNLDELQRKLKEITDGLPRM